MKNHQKGFVVPLLLAIIALLVVGGGVYVYESKKTEAPAPTDVQVQQQTGQNNSVNSAPQNTQTLPPKVTPTTSSVPVNISSISGPANLNDGQSGTWTVTASGQEPLTYGVIWGDEPEWKNVFGGMPLSDIAYKSSPSFSHTYYRVSSTGTTWTPAFFVKDAQGKTTRKGSPVNVGFTSSQTPTPVLNNITPSSGSVGTQFTLSGQYLNGFEGETYITLVNQNGQKGVISANSYLPQGANTLKFVLPASICTQAMGASGNPCPSFLTITPGTYTVSAMPWSESSNKLNLIVIAYNSQPSVTVLYPNMGEVLNNGGRENIATVRWTTSNFGNMNVTLGLLNKNGDWIKTIASDIPNTGNYNWRMDQAIASGEYKIAITSPQSMANAATGPVASDLSDGTFVISTRLITSGKTFVTLVSPNGGEALSVGSKILIKWSSLGEKPTSVTISLRSNARCPYGYSCTPLPNSFTNIAEISGNDLDKGEYEWTVSKSNVDSHGNGYLIGVMIVKDNLGNANYDDSDSSFTIN